MPPLGATCPRACFSCNSNFFVSAQPAAAASSSGYGLASSFKGGEWEGGGLRLSERPFLRKSSTLSWQAGRAQNRRVTRSHDARDDETEMFFQDQDKDMWRVSAYGDQLPNQAESVTGATTIQAEFKSLPDLDYLQELLAIQQSGPRAIGFFGTRNMGFMHQQLIEILSYAMVITKNHIYTSGASGTNAAVIRGALRAEMPELLTVILPQSLKKQPPESQDLLSKVKNVIEMPHNDHLPLLEASRRDRRIRNRTMQTVLMSMVLGTVEGYFELVALVSDKVALSIYLALQNGKALQHGHPLSRPAGHMLCFP